LHGKSNLPIAELVAEQERDTANDSRSERSTRRHAERWLANRVEGERGVVRLRGKLTTRRESGDRILQVVRHRRAARRVTRRKDASRHDRCSRYHLLAARA